MRRSLAVLALCAVVAMPAAAPAQAQDAASLLALHRSYVGWHLGDFQTFRLTGQVTGASGAVESTFRTQEMGALYRTEATQDVPGIARNAGFTGRVFWNTDYNGFTRPDFSPHEGFLISRYVLLNEGTTDLSGTLQPSQTVGGTSYDVVRVTPPNGDSIDLYVDPATGAYGHAVIDPGGPYETRYDILNYTTFANGKRHIGTFRVADEPETATFTKVEANVPVSTSDLHPPSASATWNFTGAHAVPLQVTPFAVLVNATINGVPGLFVVDTGVSDIVLSRDFARKANAHITGSSELSGIGGTVSAQEARVDTLTVGGATLSNAIVKISGNDIVTNATNNTEALGTTVVNGFLGFPLFADDIVTLNLGNKTLQIGDPATTTVDRSSGYNAMVDLSTDQPVVPIVIDKRSTINAVLDSGNPAYVDMSNEAVRRHHVSVLASEGTLTQTGMPNLGINNNMDPDQGVQIQDYVQSHRAITGIAGTEWQSCSTITSLGLGPITYQSTFACVSPSMTGDRIVMGFAFLSNFDMVFDYPEGLLLLKPHAQ